jgi:hypothetical protein
MLQADIPRSTDNVNPFAWTSASGIGRFPVIGQIVKSKRGLDGSRDGRGIDFPWKIWRTGKAEWLRCDGYIAGILILDCKPPRPATNPAVP